MCLLLLHVYEKLIKIFVLKAKQQNIAFTFFHGFMHATWFQCKIKPNERKMKWEWENY